IAYNVPGGKKNRGLALVLGYKHLAKSSDLTPENIRLAHILGWCVELLQGAFLVWDDCMDESSTRRGRPCWYKMPGVGLTAINDGNLLESGVFQLLRRHFKSRPYYIDIVELFHD
ncbi:farnesyl pyrophosphate synthase-like, partial [Nilaparvata lugens]|uniref:farnesyl pyrophosphate synthase-like n=1 Tax=Nilaparvata lugens TaxID=108931 RepID=UPI00193D7607